MTCGSVVVHGVGGWLALIGILFLGPRSGRVRDGKMNSFAPSSIPFLALGAWILTVGWFGFNVMSAQAVEGISGLVTVNSLMAMVGGTSRPSCREEMTPASSVGLSAGLVAVCAGSDVFHRSGLTTGLICLSGCSFGVQPKRNWTMYSVYGLFLGVCGA